MEIESQNEGLIIIDSKRHRMVEESMMVFANSNILDTVMLVEEQASTKNLEMASSGGQNTNNNVCYKIMAKATMNRLKTILPMIISNSQISFIHGRSLTDNNLVTFEISHFLKRKRQGKTGLAALKIDMSKAYEGLNGNSLNK